MIDLQTFILHPLIFIGIFLGLIVWIKWGMKYRNRVNYIISPLLYLFHLLSFYIAASLNLIPQRIYVIWIDLVFIHSLIIIISAALVMMYIKKEVK